MARAALRLFEPVLEPLVRQLPAGRLVEISGSSDTPCARTSTAVSLLRQAQAEGETTAWIQPRRGALFPPDLRESGIDLDALLVVHVPREHASNGALGMCKAAELLLRSGAFGLLVLDLTEGAPPPGSEAWQGRLLGLARQHHSRVVLLTEKPAHADSLGTLVGLRIEPQRLRDAPGCFGVEHHLLKNKSGGPLDVARDRYRGPWGIR